MIKTIKEAKERIALCHTRYHDKSISKDFKLWESFVEMLLKQNIKDRELRNE